jgi:hypothetical protein
LKIQLYIAYIEVFYLFEIVANRNTNLGVVIAVVILATSIITAVSTNLIQQSYATATVGLVDDAPIATSGDNNVYITWSCNKTGNDEVMFKASTDGGKIFGDKMNLSNSSKSESVDVQIAAAAAGSDVYVSWWERNQTSNEPVLRVSNDNGKTFGEKIMLSAK